MSRQEVLNILKSHLPELRRRFGVERLSLFGSVARDEAGEGSDIDLIADFGAAPTFKQYMGATLYLEDVLGNKVDLVTEGTLKPRVVPYVEEDRLDVTDAA